MIPCPEGKTWRVVKALHHRPVAGKMGQRMDARPEGHGRGALFGDQAAGPREATSRRLP